MTVKCAWCGKTIGVYDCKETVGCSVETVKETERVSHGICSRCLEKSRRDLRDMERGIRNV